MGEWVGGWAGEWVGRWVRVWIGGGWVGVGIYNRRSRSAPDAVVCVPGIRSIIHKMEPSLQVGRGILQGLGCSVTVRVCGQHFLAGPRHGGRPNPTPNPNAYLGSQPVQPKRARNAAAPLSHRGEKTSICGPRFRSADGDLPS